MGSRTDLLLTDYEAAFGELRVELVMGTTLQTALTTVLILEKVTTIRMCSFPSSRILSSPNTKSTYHACQPPAIPARGQLESSSHLRSWYSRCTHGSYRELDCRWSQRPRLWSTYLLPYGPTRLRQVFDCTLDRSAVPWRRASRMCHIPGRRSRKKEQLPNNFEHYGF